MNYILDTNIISEAIAKQPNQGAIDWLKGVDAEKLYLSVIRSQNFAIGFSSDVGTGRVGRKIRE